MIIDPDDADNEIPEPLSKMTEANKKCYSADVRVMNYLLQALPNDIYNSVDACKDAQKMWERIRRNARRQNRNQAANAGNGPVQQINESKANAGNGTVQQINESNPIV
ncbi:hypothetical protein Tco_0252071 [Tanacetum coccineum]